MKCFFILRFILVKHYIGFHFFGYICFFIQRLIYGVHTFELRYNLLQLIYGLFFIVRLGNLNQLLQGGLYFIVILF